MGKTKKRIAILLLVALIFNVFQATVMATDEGTVYAEAVKELAGGTHVLNENVKANGCEGAIFAHSAANVTIEGGNVHGVVCKGERCDGKYPGYSMAVGAWDKDTVVTIVGGNFTNDPDPDDPDQSDLIYADDGAKIVIKGGTFKSVTPQWTLNCGDKSGSTITVKGGKFYQFDPSNTKVAPEGYTEIIVEEGYKVIGPDAEGYYEVVPTEGTIYANAVKEFAGGTHVLDENVKANGCEGAIFAHSVANVTINGGNVHGVVCKGERCDGKYPGYSIAVGAWDKDTVVTIVGGNFTNDPDPDDPDQSDLIYADDGAKIVIKGGTFKSVTPQWTLNCGDKSGSTITVKGGKFYQFDPSNTKVAPEGYTEIIVEEGYKVVGPDAEGYYEVVCAHTSLNHSVEKEPTYIENGEREHFACTNCSKLFLDEAATMEVAKADLVIPKLVQVSGSDATVKDEAVDSAIKDSNTTDSSTVTIPLGSLGTTVDTVTLPVESLEKVVSENKDLTITTTEATATIDTKALDSIVEQAGNVESIKIEIKEIESTTLNKDQKKAIKNKSVAAVISAEIIANGKTISNFGGGKIKLEIPFTPEKDSKASDYKVVYIADNGDITEIPTAYINGNLVVELEHFSEYAIVNVAKASSSSSNSSAGAAPAAPVKDATPKTGSTDVSLVVMSLVGTIALAGVVIIKRYSK